MRIIKIFPALVALLVPEKAFVARAHLLVGARKVFMEEVVATLQNMFFLLAEAAWPEGAWPANE